MGFGFLLLGFGAGGLRFRVESLGFAAFVGSFVISSRELFLYKAQTLYASLESLVKLDSWLMASCQVCFISACRVHKGLRLGGVWIFSC